MPDQNFAARELGHGAQSVKRSLPEPEEREREIHAERRRPDLWAIRKRHVQ